MNDTNISIFVSCLLTSKIIYLAGGQHSTVCYITYLNGAGMTRRGLILQSYEKDKKAIKN